MRTFIIRPPRFFLFSLSPPDAVRFVFIYLFIYFFFYYLARLREGVWRTWGRGDEEDEEEEEEEEERVCGRASA
jgi:hypothetical protein